MNNHLIKDCVSLLKPRWWIKLFIKPLSILSRTLSQIPILMKSIFIVKYAESIIYFVYYHRLQWNTSIHIMLVILAQISHFTEFPDIKNLHSLSWTTIKLKLELNLNHSPYTFTRNFTQDVQSWNTNCNFQDMCIQTSTYRISIFKFCSCIPSWINHARHEISLKE